MQAGTGSGTKRLFLNAAMCRDQLSKTPSGIRPGISEAT
jgi:hypothetical protein